MFYTNCSNENHESHEWFDSLFEATCFYYECLPDVTEDETFQMGWMESNPDDEEMGELDGDWDAILITSPEDRN